MRNAIKQMFYLEDEFVFDVTFESFPYQSSMHITKEQMHVFT